MSRWSCEKRWAARHKNSTRNDEKTLTENFQARILSYQKGGDSAMAMKKAAKKAVKKTTKKTTKKSK
jgi:hypothetical protein